MKPAPFAYAVASSVDEAIHTLQQYGPDARPLAGGQSLIPAMNMRLARPAYLVDINRVAELSYIRETRDGLAIGALTRHRQVERSEVVQRANPLLQEAARQIGHFQIRTRGTIGGSLAHNDPNAEYVVVARLLEAEIVATGPGGQRVIPARDFFVGYLATTLAPDELITEVRIPRLNGKGAAFVKLARRHGDFAMISAAATMELNPDGTIKDARVALGNVGGGIPYLAAIDMTGQSPTPDLLADVAHGIAANVQPDPDGTVDVSYKKHLAGVVARRAMETALARAKGEV